LVWSELKHVLKPPI